MNQQRVNMAFTGIPSFGRSPIVEIDGPWSADFAILGVPYDAGTGYRPGPRFGPRSVRDVSTRFPFFAQDGEKGFWSILEKRHFHEGVRVVDAGDADVLYLDLDYSFQSITDSVKRILERDAVPVIIGGDHSITFPVVRAFENNGPLSILHFDAHLDFRDEVRGVKFAHGSPLRRSLELDHISSAVAIGVRGLRHQKPDYEDALEMGVKVVTAEELRKDPADVAETLRRTWTKGAGIYVSIDIDFLDPAFAPGTGTPEPGGASYPVLRDLLREVAGEFDVRGFDVVEVNPMVDNAQITSLLAAQIVTEFSAFIWDSRRKDQEGLS